MNNQTDLDKYLIIVSKNEPLTPEREEWLKENFEYVSYTDEDGESCMEVETFRAYTALVQLMKKKHHIIVDSHSAWRSIATQEKVYNDLSKKHTQEWMKTHVALPGESEHHTGLAFDLRYKFAIVPEVIRSGANTVAKKLGIQKKVFKVIENEAVQFGLVKRYPANKESITGVKEEDWHFRYVGVEHAAEMYNSNLCLEEYVQTLSLKDKSIKTKVH